MGQRLSQFLYWLGSPCMPVPPGEEDKDSGTIPGGRQVLEGWEHNLGLVSQQLA